jgi:putative transposase
VNGSRDRETGDGHRVVSPGRPIVLDVEESATQRTSARRRRYPEPHPDDVEGQSALERSRIHGELLKLGVNVSQATVAKHMARPTTPPSQSWRTFLTNHVEPIAAADFFVVPTPTCRLLFVLVMLAHARRRVVHVAVTDHPTAMWTAQQLREAFPWNETPRYLVHDRDSAFSTRATTAAAIGIEEILTAPRSPWQNAYAERLIGSIRRECLDHIVISNQRGLRRVLDEYVAYYLKSRTHLALDKDAPVSRPLAPSGNGAITAISYLGGLHHRYDRRAA